MRAEGMVRVTFLPEGRTVEFEFDTMPYQGHGEPMSVLDVAQNFNIFLDHACGGVCACTTCHLHVKEGAAVIAGVETKAALAVMTLPYSDAYFVSAYLRECTETF